ncbi:hypothetical protein KEN51_CDS0313 [Pseudomonas phage vB_Pae10145-KEN51]|nr:hypothetical protein [Pseudomonas phage ANB1]WNV50103.1 hypothetical protein [Pseudomonas phage PhiPizzaParty]WRQ05754.1 hypothetical protein IPCDMZAV_CDS0231 [Pseudomonas phage 6B]WRQ06251.1 hypothetical protein QAMIJHJT_CDS0320 [Pseudomonas phage 9-Ps-8B]WRQ06659.1 hypothetical protein FOPPYZMZ_CDS0319 [Pseudomonas phage 9Ps-7B]WRQ07010.1 hypothetical protein ZBUARNPM_CDS0261 [Pseudomonas phage 14Ps5-6]
MPLSNKHNGEPSWLPFMLLDHDLMILNTWS